MSLFATLILIQFLAFAVCTIVLRTNLPQSVHRTVRKNSKRLDDSVSKRRKKIELESLDQSFIRVYVGMALLFGMTILAGLIVAGISIPLPSLDAGFENDPIELPAPSPIDNMRWPLVSVYTISTLMIAPFLILNLYQSAIKHFHSGANLRFMEYYRRESVTAWKKSEEDERTWDSSEVVRETDRPLPRTAPVRRSAQRHR